MTQLFRFPQARTRDPAVAVWLQAAPGALGAVARQWFEVLRRSGDDVRELLHDGHPTACVGEAAFAYVDVFSAHVNVGFFRGAALPDPAGLLQGTGRLMRHVKLRSGAPVDEGALTVLIAAAYADMTTQVRLEVERGRSASS